MKIDFTTNYCGAYWSDGKFQTSVKDGKSKPVSELDYTCQEHDRSYSISKDLSDLEKADDLFYQQNFGQGPRRSLYAVLVKRGNQLNRKINFLLPWIYPDEFKVKSNTVSGDPSRTFRDTSNSVITVSPKQRNTVLADTVEPKIKQAGNLRGEFIEPTVKEKQQNSCGNCSEYNPYKYKEYTVFQQSVANPKVYYPFTRSLRRTFRKQKKKKNRRIYIDFE